MFMSNSYKNTNAGVGPVHCCWAPVPSSLSGPGDGAVAGLRQLHHQPPDLHCVQCQVPQILHQIAALQKLSAFLLHVKQ